MRKCLITLIFSLSSILAQNWTIDTIDSSGDANDCSIVVDNQNYPHIVYCFRQPQGGNSYCYWVKYARWNGIGWEFQSVETTTTVFFTTAKLCLDNQNRPHIVYAKDSVQFKYAYYDGNSWQISMIDSFNVRSNEVLRGCIDIALSESSVPHICYSFINYTDSISGIKYACRSGDSWIIQTVWQENRIPTAPPFLFSLFTTAIDLDNAGYPVIAFEIYHHHRTSIDTGFLYCASFNGQTWKIDTVEKWTGVAIRYWVYSLKVNSPDRIHIFYQCDFYLFHAVTEGDSWVFEYIDLNDIHVNVGDMILDGDKPNVVYSSGFDPLTYAYKVDTLWNFELIDPGDLRLFPSIAQDNENRLHVSYIRYPDCLYYARRESPSIAEKELQSIAESKTLIEIYPNPAKGVIYIRFPLTYSLPHWWGADRRRGIKIFDVSGKMVREIATSATQTRKDRIIETKISLKGINPGIYFLRFGKETKKFIVTK